MATSFDNIGGASQAHPSEIVRPFFPTPESIERYLPPRKAEIRAQLTSVEGQEQLFAQLMQRQDDLRKAHPDFQPELLRQQLAETGEALKANAQFVEKMKSPEQQGMLRRAWETVKKFPGRHPVITTLLLVALAAGGATYMGYLPAIDFSAWWARLTSLLHVGGGGAASGAGEAVAETAAGAAAETATAVAEGVADFSLKTIGHAIEYGGQSYSVEEFAKMIGGMATKPEFVQILRDATSKASTENELMRLLERLGIGYSTGGAGPLESWLPMK